MESSEFSASLLQYEWAEQTACSGTTCDTYRVRHYGKLLFLKRLKLQYANDIRYREALRKEFETGYRLEHPNLVRYVSFSEDGILMEYVDGETLAQRLASNPDSLKSRKQTDRLLGQLLSAVDYLHQHQVLHLDLKPDNLLLTRIVDHVKLIDLGCCLTDTFTDTVGLTSGYAAPEQLSGGVLDVRTDIYAIGRIMSQLPCHAIYNKVIARCTQADPAQRYQSVEQLRQALFCNKPLLKYAICSILLVGIAIIFSLHPRSTSPSELPTVAPHSLAVETPQAAKAPVERPETIVVAQHASPRQKDDLTRMREETERLMNAACKTTILTFCDSLFPSPSPTTGESWSKATTEFHDKSVTIGTQMVSKYPQLAESTVRQEAERQFQALVAYVFNRMRENAAQTNSEE